MRISSFYCRWISFLLGIYILLLFRDVFISLYVYFKYKTFYLDFSFKEAFHATLGGGVPCFIIHWLLYKFGSEKYKK